MASCWAHSSAPTRYPDPSLVRLRTSKIHPNLSDSSFLSVSSNLQRSRKMLRNGIFIHTKKLFCYLLPLFKTNVLCCTLGLLFTSDFLSYFTSDVIKMEQWLLTSPYYLFFMSISYDQVHLRVITFLFLSCLKEIDQFLYNNRTKVVLLKKTKQKKNNFICLCFWPCL